MISVCFDVKIKILTYWYIII